MRQIENERKESLIIFEKRTNDKIKALNNEYSFQITFDNNITIIAMVVIGLLLIIFPIFDLVSLIKSIQNFKSKTEPIIKDPHQKVSYIEVKKIKKLDLYIEIGKKIKHFEEASFTSSN
jgi:hypothetical protein